MDDRSKDWKSAQGNTDLNVGGREEYCSELQLELDANNWLQEELLKRLDLHVRKEDRNYMAVRTLINGRLFRPGLIHVYLLRYGPFQNGLLNLEFLSKICEDTSSDLIIAKHYYESYDGARLPRPLVRNVLRKVVSNGSADAILTALSALRFAEVLPCDRGGNSIAVALHPELFSTIEKWNDIRLGKQVNGR